MLQDDPLARFFYETECIKGTWSVRELRRQISTNLYFRSGVSKDPKKLLASIEPEKNTAALTIRQPFAFEFLGLNAKDVVTEYTAEPTPMCKSSTQRRSARGDACLQRTTLILYVCNRRFVPIRYMGL